MLGTLGAVAPAPPARVLLLPAGAAESVATTTPFAALVRLVPPARGPPAA